MRLLLGEGARVEHRVFDAELARPFLGVADALVHRGGRAEELDPAARPQEPGRVRLAGEREMLGHAALDQRRVFPRDLGVALGARMPPVAGQERREPGQRPPVIVRIDRAVEPVPEDLGPAAREAIGVDRLALDEAGVAERGPLPRRLTVDEEHRAPALLQMHRDRHADDPGSEHHHIRAHPALSSLIEHCLARPSGECEGHLTAARLT